METSIDKIASSIDNYYNVEQIAVIKNTIAKGTTDQELALFLYTAKENNLSALKKEIWCYKDKRGNLLIFAGRDGFLKKAQENPLFNGVRSSEVCENDKITLDIPNGKIKHEINPKEPRGVIIGAYCIVFRKGGEPTIEYIDFKVYNKGYNAWKTHPAEMIKKVAETHALKKAFGISGLQSEYDYTVVDEVATPIDANIQHEISEQQISDLLDAKLESLTRTEQTQAYEIINKQQKERYPKLLNFLKSK